MDGRGSMHENILLPTDGSRGASRGAARALEMAEEHDATIHVLYVVDARYQATPALSSVELYLEECEHRGAMTCEEVVGEARDRGLDCVVECARGLPHEVIPAYAIEHDVDLIVMGQHGTSGRTNPHSGSTTDRVQRSTEVPVLPV